MRVLLGAIRGLAVGSDRVAMCAMVWGARTL